MAKVQKRITVDLTSAEVKARLIERANEADMDQKDFVTFLIMNAPAPFANEQSEIIHKASEKTGMSFDAIVKNGASQFAEKILNSEDENIGGADGRVHRLVKLMMDRNEQAENWYEKTEITQGKLIEFAEQEEGKTINRSSVKRYLSSNEVMIQNHHKKNGIEPDHNRKVFNYERKLKKSNDSETKQEG